MNDQPRRSEANRAAAFGTGAVLALCAILTLTYYVIRPSSVQQIMKDPKVKLSLSEIEDVAIAIKTGEIHGKERRRRLADAIIARFYHIGDIMLFDALVTRWKQTGEYAVILIRVEEGISKCRRRAASLLDWLAGADEATARRLMRVDRVFRECSEPEVLVSVILLMSKKVLNEHREACETLLSRNDVSEKVKEIMRERMAELSGQ